MRIDFQINSSEGGKFLQACEAAIRNVGAGSKAATIEAGLTIMTESTGQVPVDTGALAMSSYLGVSRRSDTKNYTYGAIMGYGNLRGLSDIVEFGPVEWLMEPSEIINPKNGLPVTAYASVVHEDLDMPHINGGKAKFLEDPVRNYASGNFARTAMTYWGRAIKWASQGRLRYDVRTKKFKPIFGSRLVYHTYSNEKRSTGVQRGGRSVNKGAER